MAKPLLLCANTENEKQRESVRWDEPQETTPSRRRFCSSFLWFSEVQHQRSKHHVIITSTSHLLKSTEQRRIQKLWKIRSIWGINTIYAEGKIWKCVPNQYEYILIAENLPESTVVFVQRMQKLVQDIKPVQTGSDWPHSRLAVSPYGSFTSQDEFYCQSIWFYINEQVNKSTWSSSGLTVRCL